MKNQIKNISRLILFLAFNLLYRTVFAQFNEKEIKNYNAGVECFKINELHKADSLFSQSIRIQPHQDAYYNRAHARFKLNDEKRYCYDLNSAIKLGDQDALKEYNKYCATKDFPNIDSIKPIEVKYKTGDSSILFTACLNDAKDTMAIYYFENDTKFFAYLMEMPEFPGGEEKLYYFLATNIKYPNNAKEAGIQGTVYLSFDISETGEIDNTKVVRGVNKGGLNEEALRVLNLMPEWKPGKYLNQNVKVRYNLPINYTLR